MSDNEDDTRTIVTLSVGARVGAVVAVLLLVAAGYLMWSPIQLYPSNGFPIMCGTAAAPPVDELGSAACGDVNVIRQWQAGSVTLAALFVAAGSIYAFGVRRRGERLIGSPASSDTEPSTPSSD